MSQEDHQRNIEALNRVGSLLEQLPECTARRALLREWQRLGHHQLRLAEIRALIRRSTLSPPRRQ